MPSSQISQPKSVDLYESVAKLAKAGEQAGFRIEQMIELLDAGVSVEGLINLIAWRMDTMQNSFVGTKTKPYKCSECGQDLRLA
jgi:hypothetical protein